MQIKHSNFGAWDKSDAGQTGGPGWIIIIWGRLISSSRLWSGRRRGRGWGPASAACLRPGAGSLSSWSGCSITWPGLTLRTADWSHPHGKTLSTGYYHQTRTQTDELIVDDVVSRYVLSDHPNVVNYHRWTGGRADYTRLFCGGEVRQGVLHSEFRPAWYLPKNEWTQCVDKTYLKKSVCGFKKKCL